MKRQSKIHEYFQSENSYSSDEISDQEGSESEDHEESLNQKKSRRLPLRWTRVFKVSRDPIHETETFNLEDDESDFIDLNQESSHQENSDWKTIFNPDDFKGQYEDLLCDKYQLSQEQLLQYAKDVTLIRQQFSQKADLLEQEEDQIYSDLSLRRLKAPSILKRKKLGASESESDSSQEDDQALKYHGSQQEKRGKKDLSLQEITNIAHDAIVKLKSDKEIAASYKVKKTCIRSLVMKIKKNPGYIAELKSKHQEKERQTQLICSSVKSYLQSGHHIWRASLIQQKLLEDHNVSVPVSKVRLVLNQTLKGKFKQIKRIAFLGNAQRCLVMRQFYAKEMIAILQSGKTIYNFDESFINQTFFTRRKWCFGEENNSVPIKKVSPRISVFLVISSLGQAYLSLSQSNTKSSKVILFFEYLFEILDSEQPDWKETSVLLMDGAPYHKSEDTLEYLKKKNVPVFISAPYSYDAAICELWFSYFKSQDLNPENLKSGKRQASLHILISSDLFKIQLTWQQIGLRI